jgi:MFS family permease
MTMLIAGRAVQGIGGGFLGSVIYVVIGRGYPPSARPRMLALASSAWVVPGLIGPWPG